MSQRVGFFVRRVLVVSAHIAASSPLAVSAGQASQPPDKSAAANAQAAQDYLRESGRKVDLTSDGVLTA